MFTDFKYALRLLSKSPAFIFLLITVMTFGLAICLYLLSFVHSLVFKPLPFDGGDRIVVIDKLANGMRFDSGLVDVDAVSIMQQSQSFSESGIIGSYRGNLTIENKTYSHMASSIEPSVLTLTNVSPILGRAFTQADAVEGAPLVALLSYELWQRYFPNDKKVLGEIIKINQDRATIIGVMPKGYRFPGYSEIWLPVTRELFIRDDGEEWTHSAVAKLKEHVSIGTANDDVNIIMEKLAKLHPLSNYGVSAYVETFQKNYVGENLMAGIWIMIFCALFLLVLTVLNASMMLLSKSFEYSRETSMRRALGAPRLRLLIQMLWPSVIISVVAGGLALLITAWSLELTNFYFNSFDFLGAPYWLDFTFEPFNFYITFIVVVSVVIISGLLPGIRASGARFNALLNQSGGGATNYQISKLSRYLLKWEVSLSAFILTIALLLIVNIHQSSIDNNQYLKSNMLTGMFVLPVSDGNYDDNDKRNRYLDRLKSTIAALPEVQGVAFSSALPGSGSWASRVHARDLTTTALPIYANANYIDEDLLQLTKIPLLKGRYFTAMDDHNQPLVAIISQSLAKTLWGDGEVIGKKIVFDDFEDRPVALIVGVVDDIFHGLSINHFARLGGVYVPIKQLNYSFYQFAIHYQDSGLGLLDSVDKIMLEIDPDVPPFLGMSYEKLLSVYSSGLEFSSQLFTLLGAISLLLTGAGIYGITQNSINQKRRDIAIRRSLGASNFQILLLFLRTTMWEQFIALAVGGTVSTLFCYWQLKIFVLSDQAMLLNMLCVLLVLFMVIVCAIFIPLRKVLMGKPGIDLRSD